MRVMVMVKATGDSEAGVMPSEQLLAEMGRFNEELVKAGVMLAGEGLHPSTKGVRVRFSGNTRSVVDGPFAETKELVAGFWLWQVHSMDEAIEWARRCPNPMPGDSEIEIRPVFEAEDFGAEFTPELREQEERLRAECLSVEVDRLFAAAIEEQIRLDLHGNLLSWALEPCVRAQRASIWLRRRCSCSRSSGVSSAPKSSASNTCRISTSASWNGARLSHSIASSFDFTCQSQKPATSSLVSANGPSITVRLPPENCTRDPFELGWSPSPASITPAFTSSSLNLPISASRFLSGRTPASLFWSAFTSTMNRISSLSLAGGMCPAL